MLPYQFEFKIAWKIMEENHFHIISTLFMTTNFLNIFITTYFYMHKSPFARAMLYCSIIKIDITAFAALTRFSPRTSIWDELTDKKLFFPNHLTITLLFCTQNWCCKLLGASSKLHIWAQYQLLQCLTQITSPGLNLSSCFHWIYLIHLTNHFGLNHHHHHHHGTEHPCHCESLTFQYLSDQGI